MTGGQWWPGQMAGAVTALGRVARTQRDRRLQQMVLELAGACDAFERSPDQGQADALAARANALAATATALDETDVASVARSVVAALAAPPPAAAARPPAPASPPLAAAPAPPAGAPAAPPAPVAPSVGAGPPAPHQPPLILVVDDDPEIRRLFLFRLRAAGFRVTLAEDGEQGMAKARDEQPDLIFCDLRMPLVPGELLILALGLEARTASIPIVVVTGDPSRLGPEHKVAAVLVKPVAAATMIETARRLTAPAGRGGS